MDNHLQPNSYSPYNIFRFFDKVYDFLLKSAGNLKNVVPYPKVVDLLKKF